MTKDAAPSKSPLIIIPGGTPTSGSLRHFETRFRDAEVRRDAADVDRKIASVPIEQGGGMLPTCQFTNHPDIPKAYILLKYLTPGGLETGYECLADLILGDNNDPEELTIMLVCPGCLLQGQKHEQDCQLRMNQRNKYFEFVPAKGPQMITFMGETYHSAGMITKSEKFKCPDCHWTARIDMNRVWPD